MSASKVRVRIELEDKVFSFEGTPDKVFETVVKWFCKIAPGLEVISHIVYTPDIDELARNLVGIATITPNGIALSPELKLSTADAICICLATAFLGKKIGRWEKESMGKGDIASFSGRSVGDVSKRISDLKKLRLIELINKDEYRITSLGIKHLTDKIIPKLRKVIR